APFRCACPPRALQPSPARRSSDLHEHAARAAAGVIDPAFVGFQHLDHRADDRAGGVELAAALALAARELPEEVFIDPTEQVARLDRKSTRLNSSHVKISYAVFCLK